MTPNFLESHISQIPAIQLLQRLGFAYLSPEEVAMERRGGSAPVGAAWALARNKRACGLFAKAIKVLASDKPAPLVALNRPATPLNDAQLGGYFFAPVGR